jgi:hypothetical protein
MLRWALRDSNLQPSACKFAALPRLKPTGSSEVKMKISGLQGLENHVQSLIDHSPQVSILHDNVDLELLVTQDEQLSVEGRHQLLNAFQQTILFILQSG